MLPLSVKAIGLCGSSDKNIPLEVCSKKGIVVFNAPSANANAIKELVVASLVMSARPIYPAKEWIQTLQESRDLEKVIEKGKSNVFSKRGVDIDNLINKSKNELAVTLVDAECIEPVELLNDLRSIHQMLSVHYIS